MSIGDWIVANGLDAVQTLAIVVALFLSVVEFRRSRRASAIALEHDIVKSHRELFSQLVADPGLMRIIEPAAETGLAPVTPKERQFIRLLILHVYATFRANRGGILETTPSDRESIAHFFQLPLPAVVWRDEGTLYRPDFRAYVDGILAESHRLKGGTADPQPVAAVTKDATTY